MQKYKMT